MTAKKGYTAEQLRIAREIVDQEELIEAERARRQPKRKRSGKPMHSWESEQWRLNRGDIVGIALLVLAVVIWILPLGYCPRPESWPEGCWWVFSNNGGMWVEKFGWFNGSRINHAIIVGLIGGLILLSRTLRSPHR